MATKKDTAREKGATRNTKPVEGNPADELAKHIAAILNYPDTPAQIYNDLADAVHNLDTPPRFFDSEEYVAMCLRQHFKGSGMTTTQKDTPPDDELPELLAAVFAHPDLPKPIWDHIAEGLCELDDDFEKYENPEVMREVLAGHKTCREAGREGG
ncbi:MAG: hypothetical protein H0T45_01550 [Pyrinomonadaceae bacterium]|nr:hypothetical protein [Pyrinomonadaceae bacterium]